jgi:hypothetical protein
LRFSGISNRPKAKEEGRSPRGAARKRRANLTGERFGIQGDRDNRNDRSAGNEKALRVTGHWMVDLSAIPIDVESFSHNTA